MKNYLFGLALLSSVFQSYAQTCPVCAIDLTCDSVPANPKLCPASLPTDTAGNYYSADLTFYVPQQFQHPTFGTVIINQIDITGVTNLPPGMSWTAYNYLGVATNSFFPPANPPASERGCAKICGTPPLPFDDSIYVSTIAYVTALGTNATQNTTFGIHLTIVPGASGNSGFTMSNSVGCGSVTSLFTSLHPSGGNTGYSYQWNFGNGLQSVSENPPQQTYNSPGTYSASLQTTIDTFPNTLAQITITNIGCSDIGTDPDLYLKIFDGSGALVLSTKNSPVTGQAPQTWNLASIFNNPVYTIQVWDADSAEGQGSDDNCNNGSETSQGGIALLMPAPGQYGNTTQTGTNQNLSLSYTINKPVLIFNDTSVINVYTIPAPPVIMYSPNDSICAGDSALLSVSGGFGSYQWYRDTVLLVGEDDSVYVAKQTGNYWVHITNSSGCGNNSGTQKITLIPMPPKPNFIFIGNNTLKTFVSGYPLQWYLNGSPIPGATSQTLVFSASGYYSVSATTLICVSFSDSAHYNFTPPAGISEASVIGSYKLFPNPNNGKFIISFETFKSENVRISVSDILGRIIYYSEIKNVNGKILRNIQLADADAGIYFLKLEAGNNIINSRVVIQR